MPVLSNNPKNTLTYGEYSKRLKEKLEKNPNDPDPEVQKFKKELQEFNARFAPTQKELDSIAESARLATNPLKPVIPQVIAAANSLQPTIKSIEAAYQTIQPMLDNIQAFMPPPYLLQAMEKVAEDFRRMSEPMRAIGEVIAIYQAPLLYYKLPELHNNVVLEEYEPVEIEIEPTQNPEAELLKENNFLRNQIIRLQAQIIQKQGQVYSYDTESKTFVVKKKGYGALTFITKRENPHLGTFFDICMQILEERGYMVGDFKEVYISKADIRAGFKTRGEPDITDDLIYSVRSNLVKDKIAPQKLSDYVDISTYKEGKGGYCFRIRIKPKVLDF